MPTGCSVTAWICPGPGPIPRSEVHTAPRRGSRWSWGSVTWARYRLETADGRELPNQSDPGNPLVRYTIRGPFPPVRPGALPAVLPAVDTVWLEPVVPQLYCIAVGDSVPEFVPAADPDPELLSNVMIFYSFDAGGRGRQAGLLKVRLDPSLVERPASAPPPVFPTRFHEPAWPLPPLGDLHRIGASVARCGPPEAPMSVASTIWQGTAGGRLLVLSYGGKPRKYLFDIDRDSMVDLEMWDASGTGRFDAEREAHYAIPPFLLPPPGPPPFNPAVFADLSPDSMSALREFREAGTYVPRTGPEDAMTERPFEEAGRYSPRGPQPASTTYGGFVAGPAAGAGGTGAAAAGPAQRGRTLPARPVGVPDSLR
jgi:hypothetical protein